MGELNKKCMCNIRRKNKNVRFILIISHFCHLPFVHVMIISTLTRGYLLSPVWLFSQHLFSTLGFAGGSDGKESPAMQETGSILGSGRPPGEGNGHSFEYSCLVNPVNKGVWQAIQSMGS